MFLVDNPVLQRDLLVNLRGLRGFVLLWTYVAALGLIVYAAWPSQQRLDLTQSPEEAKRLVNLFFVGQYILLSLMTPSFAAGALCGEKERKTFEMLLASPLKPSAVVLGKLLASLCQLAVLVFCSLPIVMLCLPLGGMSLYEVLATYVGMAASTATFGMIAVWASGFFRRTVAALVVSYLLILPLALLGTLVYQGLEMAAEVRIVALGAVTPLAALVVCGLLLRATSRRLLYPPDIGSEGQDVVDPELEQDQAVGMVIRSDQFPDMLFVPAKRSDLLADGANPVFDKEMRSEIFGQGTLMLRLVIQLSMFLAIPMMAICLFVFPQWAPRYVGYVLLFNLLVGPVFSAGSVTSERERETLELLLTTLLSPWQILGGKLLSSLRIATVLTAFVGWPMLLAWALPPGTFWGDTWTFVGYLSILLLACVTTTVVPLFFSVITRKTAVSLLTSYVMLAALFMLPPAVEAFAQVFYPDAPMTRWIAHLTFTSPFSTAFALPLTLGASATEKIAIVGDVRIYVAFVAFHLLLNGLLLAAIAWLFNVRWRVTG